MPGLTKHHFYTEPLTKLFPHNLNVLDSQLLENSLGYLVGGATAGSLCAETDLGDLIRKRGVILLPFPVYLNHARLGFMGDRFVCLFESTRDLGETREVPDL